MDVSIIKSTPKQVIPHNKKRKVDNTLIPSSFYATATSSTSQPLTSSPLQLPQPSATSSLLQQSSTSTLPTSLQPPSKQKVVRKNVVKDATTFLSYDDIDETIVSPDFTPKRLPGSQVQQHNSHLLTKAFDFFQLYFTDETIEKIVKHTNTYAWLNIESKKSYSDNEGGWTETNEKEIKQLIALLIYQGLVKVSTFNRYWSTKSLYHGLWARHFMSRNRFYSLLAMLHIVDPCTEDKTKRLKKVNEFIEDFREKCKSLYQPYQHVAVDERLVKSKHRSGIRQYIANKPAKFGLKLWVIADSKNGYTYDFYVYTGKCGEVYSNGLGYHVVMKLVAPLLDQGYHMFFDNFYTSVQLLNDLHSMKTPSCGTVTENRKGFPASLKNGKVWARKKERGEMRWVRENELLALQWIDNKVVTMLSTIDSANEHVVVERKVKVNQKWEKVMVKKPYVVERYNAYMNAVDKSDQILAKYNLLRKTIKWWKTLFFHMIDIASVNSFILFQEHRKSNRGKVSLHRPGRYSILEFREEIIRNIVDLDEYANPPIYKVVKDIGVYTSVHNPQFAETKRNCKVCYAKTKQTLKVFTFCSAPQCNVHLHFTKEKNCFQEWHTPEYHRKH